MGSAALVMTIYLGGGRKSQKILVLACVVLKIDTTCIVLRGCFYSNSFTCSCLRFQHLLSTNYITIHHLSFNELKKQFLPIHLNEVTVWEQ